MALFEGYERRIDQINAVLNSYGISSIEEAEKIAEKACACIKGNVYHRSDVGTTDLVNKRVEHMKEILN